VKSLCRRRPRSRSWEQGDSVVFRFTPDGAVVPAATSAAVNVVGEVDDRGSWWQLWLSARVTGRPRQRLASCCCSRSYGVGVAAASARWVALTSQVPTQ
jgi:hypothetical protein